MENASANVHLPIGLGFIATKVTTVSVELEIESLLVVFHWLLVFKSVMRG